MHESIKQRVPRLGNGGITTLAAERQSASWAVLAGPPHTSHVPVLTTSHRCVHEPQQGQEQRGVARPPCPSGCPAAQGAWVPPLSWCSTLHCSSFCAALWSTVSSTGLILQLGGDVAQQTPPNLCSSGNRTPMVLNPPARTGTAVGVGDNCHPQAWVKPPGPPASP